MKATVVAMALASTGAFLFESIGPAAASPLLAPTAVLSKTLNAQDPVQPVYYGYGGYRRYYGGYRRYYGGYGRRYGYGRYYRGGHRYYGRGRHYRRHGRYYGYRGYYPYHRGYYRYYRYGGH